jgi:hypothetical protein
VKSTGDTRLPDVPKPLSAGMNARGSPAAILAEKIGSVRLRLVRGRFL